MRRFDAAPRRATSKGHKSFISCTATHPASRYLHTTPFCARGAPVPEDFEPAVAECAQGGVVVLAAGALGVVEVPGPGGTAQAGEGPLVHGVSQVAVAGEPVGDDQVTLARAAGDWCAPGVALQGVRRGELLDVLADLSGDPGGETATE